MRRKNYYGKMETTLECKTLEGAYDSCPFVWKEFKASGYRTLFAEDVMKQAIFNMDRVGFHNVPCDYYLRPLLLAHSNHTGHEVRLLCHLCYGILYLL